ncbi:hypothetical protein PV326_000997, partial [Microctonus aethiopoides]
SKSAKTHPHGHESFSGLIGKVQTVDSDPNFQARTQFVPGEKYIALLLPGSSTLTELELASRCKLQHELGRQVVLTSHRTCFLYQQLMSFKPFVSFTFYPSRNFVRTLDLHIARFVGIEDFFNLISQVEIYVRILDLHLARLEGIEDLHLARLEEIEGIIKDELFNFSRF